MAFPDHIDPAEAKIISKLIHRALGKGWVVSVYDGEEWPVKRSSDYEVITAEIAATDETHLRFRTQDGDNRGWMMLVHGNGDEVISDYSDNGWMDQLVEGIDV